MATFPADVLADLNERQEIWIETDGRRTIIWVVVDGSDVFVRSVSGERGRWYRDCLANPEVTIHFRGRPTREPVRAHAVHAPDADSIARCSRALEQKYARDPALNSMLRPETLRTTVRLEPA